MKQYETNIPSEYLIEVVKDLGKAMDIEIDVQQLDDLFESVGENKWYSEVFIARHKTDPGCFILVELRNNDYIFGFVIRCNETNYLQAKATLLRWDQFCREEYAQPYIPIDLEDVFLKEENMLNHLVKIYGLDDL
ncbi:hypothetical protein [Brevibacillus sp. SYSU BS000544]|uniref:hypothetical protein n=1 Tax=Brevibacillus sp. SYSU BS000544 TaxID=3416443 RepID=UPI003CE5786D